LQRRLVAISQKTVVLLYRAAMNVEEQIKQLCQKMIGTKSDEEAIELARELRPLLDRRVVELRTTPHGAPAREQKY
jgi:signal transduction histidine kinase